MELEHADEEALLGKQDASTHQPSGYRIEFKDRLFALAFGAQVAAVVVVALTVGVPNVFNIYFTIHGDDSSHGLKMFWIFLLTSCVGGGVSALWLHILQRHASEVINWTLRGSIGVLIVSSLLAFVDSGIGGRAVGFVNLFFAVTVLIYYRSIQPMIAFAASNLAAASRILYEFPNLITMAYLALVVQVVWTLVWSVAAVGVLAKSAVNFHDASSFSNVCFFFMLLSHFWFVEVAKNVVHCIAAGAVGEWWFGLHDATTVQRSKIRAVTISLGSICFGSLAIAVLSALKTLLLSTPRRKGRRSPNACLECIIRFVRRNIQYFNKFAFCQVAIYGKDFQTAGYDTMRLFRDRGWSALLNDSLISSVLSIGSLVVGATSGAIGSSWVYMTMECTPAEVQAHGDQCETFNVVVLTFLACSSIGYAMCAIVSSVLDSIVSTIFVCFAEDPAALQQAHAEEHRRLVEAWRRHKPDLLAFPSPA
ncbi:hypothetical protein Poli38472_014812 [Pythium oligandrum]|uniref:Choline transporter-like protein n=1 Tax=Pythium oligandrum TaxID=41045 RepID=A0A8K1FLJ6_PYTOL|nr:hypothetical protein Poli38472_014812 [Pythium oligandrum]|eukprot:TMW63902.1 hypothetical protein Poli38472_014812 [Pythium oligandrum]